MNPHRTTVPVRAVLQRAMHSAVVWQWGFNGLRLASGIILLPLIVRHLSDSELGMYYIFLSLLAILPMLDNTFSLNITRYVGYAMGGAVTLRPQGTDFTSTLNHPNYPLIWSLLESTRTLYRWIALFVIVFLGLIGTAVISLGVSDTPMPRLTWTAWAITLLAAALEIYLGWWNAFLRGINHVVVSSQLAVLGYSIKLILSSILLVYGFGLLSVPIATLISSPLQRSLSRRACLRHLKAHPKPDTPAESGWLLRIIWPNSWRVGLHLLSHYAYLNGLAFLCLIFFGLEGNAIYGLSMQIMLIIHGMSGVWTYVKWPEVNRLRAAGQLQQLRALLWPRVWLQSLTFIILATAAISAGPWVLKLLSAEKELLPVLWLSLLAVNSFLELQFSFWGVLISTENRIPYLWPAVATNLTTVLLAFLLIQLTPLGLPALVLAPLLTGMLFHHWYWPRLGARSLDTTLLSYLFQGPRRSG